MKFKNFFLILALFMVLLCCFSAVSASENVDDSVAVSDDAAMDEVVSEVDSAGESISAENDENIELGVNTEDNLQDSESKVYYVSNSSLEGDGSLKNPYNWTTAYSQANDGDEIKFTEGTYTDSLNIDKNLTLTGLNNAVLSSGQFTLNSNKRVSIVNFNINDMAVSNNGLLTLDKITMVGNKGITNGAGAELYIAGSSFSDYSAAVSLIDNHGILNIMATTFTNIANTAGNGGVIYNRDGSVSTIKNTKFIANSAATGSAIYSVGNSVTVNNSIFVDNSEVANGVINGMNINVYNSEFDNINANINIVDKGSGEAEVSGTYVSDYTSMQVSKIAILLKNNNDNSEKTAEVHVNPDTPFTVSVTDLSAGFYTGYLLDQNSNRFKFTEQEQSVGVIYVSPAGNGDGTSKDNATNLTYAFSKSSNGGIIYLTSGDYSYSSGVTIRGDISILADDDVKLNANGQTWTFSGRNAYIENINFTNVAIVATSSANNLTIYGSDFYNCNRAIQSSAIYTNIIGGIFSHNANSVYLSNDRIKELNIFDSKFISNTGSSVYIADGDYRTFKFILENSYFADNNAPYNALIYSAMHVNTFEIRNSTFLRNTGYKSGVYYGYISNQYVRVYSSTFINNTATYDNQNDVAGVFKLGDNLWWNRFTAVDSRFEGNSAPYAGVVRVDSGGVAFRNSTFIENHAKSGGVIQNTRASIELINSTFYKNYATENSGIVRILNWGDVVIHNSTFDSNHAGKDAGVIGIEGRGRLDCYDSKFINNSADRAGAIGVRLGTIKVYNSEFINNTATSYVGAIAATGQNDIIIAGSKFIENSAPFAGAVGSQSGDISILDSYFESNTAVHGGAIGSQGGTVKINGSEFKYNVASNASGAIYNDGGQIDVYSSEFTENTANIQAGVIGVTGESSIVNIHDSIFVSNNAVRAGVVGADDGIVNIYDSNFTSNYAVQAGVVATTGVGVINIYGSNFNKNNATLAGAVASEGGLITIDGSTFSENNATHGGAIGSNNGEIIISNSVFTQNHATVGSGAIFNTGGHILVSTSKFISNTAYGSNASAGQAAAIGLTNNGFIEVYSSEFNDNRAGYRGGAIGSADGIMIIGDSNFTQNYARSEGGAIGVTGNANVTIYGSNFNSNWVETQAGVLGIESGTVSISDSKFTNNHVGGPGAVIGIRLSGKVNVSSSTFSSNYAGYATVFYVTGGELNVVSSYASDNTAGTDAGVIGVVGTSNVNVENSTFENNKADRAAVVGAQGGTVKITNSTFLNNNATSQAGVIATSIDPVDKTYGTIVVYDSTFKNNYAQTAGVIGAEAGTITVYSSTFENNKAYNDAVVGAREATVKVYSSDFINNHAEYAIGAIGVTGKGSVEVDDSMFVNNSASFGVGAIGSDNGMIKVNNSIFLQNHAIQAGVFAITGNASLLIENSIFNENHAITNSGVIYSDNGTVTIKNSQFDDNYAHTAGVATVTGIGKINIENSGFTGNRASNSSGVLYGDSELNIINSTFTNNNAGIQAGVIGVTGGKVYIKESEFENNSADRAGVVGAEEGIVIIEDSNFTNNRAITEAGVIATTGTGNITILSSKFEGNSAYRAGVVGAENGTITLKDSVFTKNNAELFAGVIGLTGIATVDVVNGNFIENSANYAAGVIVNIGLGNITIDSSKFVKNIASYGGVIGSNYGLVSVKDSVFDQNSAIHGGVMLINGTGTLNITDSNFTNNKASNASGVIYANGNVNIDASRFENNSAAVRAGVIGSTGGKVNVKESVFTNNTAGRAGVIGSEEGEVIIEDCEFSLNTADEAGVIATTGTGKVDIKSSSFNKNSAVRAGVIGAEGGSIVVDDCEFNENSVTEYGGVIGLSENAEIDVFNSKFTNNAATLAGVIANIGSGTIEVENSTFKNNDAYYGGVIGAVAGNVYIKHSSFDNNSATHGGAIATSNDQTTISIEDSNFTNNKALDASGAIYGGSGHIIVKTSLFENNTAVNNAGAIGVTGVGEVSISDSKFINNSANRAGAIGADNGKISIENSVFTSNNAYEAGAIGTTGQSLVTIINSNFTQNKASRAGVIGNEKGKSVIKNSNFISNSADYVGVLYLGGENSEVDRCKFFHNVAPEISAILVDGINATVHNSNFDNNTNGKTLVIGGKSRNTTLENNTGLDDIEYQSYVNVELPRFIFINNEYDIIFTVAADDITKLDGILTVNFTDKNVVYTFNVNSTNNTFVVNLDTDDYDYGTYSINVTYKANNDYCTDYNGIVEFTVSKNIFPVSIKVENVTYGRNVTIEVHSDIDATFNVTVGNIKTTVTVKDGIGTVDLGKLAGGDYTVTVSFAGNETFQEITNSTNFTVSPVETQMEVSVENGTIAQNAVVTVTSNVNGKYRIFIDGVYDSEFTIDGAPAVINIPLITKAGKYDVVVTYEGNENYTEASAKETFSIIGYDSELKIVSVSKDGDKYVYEFIIYLKDIDGNIVDNVPVNYTVVLADNSEKTFVGYSNRTFRLSENVPLVDLSANVEGIKVETNYPFKVLQYIIDYAQAGSTIVLSHDYAWTADDSCIVVDKQLTIDGNGHTIDAADSSKIFSVAGDNVVLKNMTLTRGYNRLHSTFQSGSDASVVLWEGNNGMMDDVNITDSMSYYSHASNYRAYCAAVVWKGNDGLINNSIFQNCRQSTCHASAIIWFGDNGVVDSTEFINCMGKRGPYAQGEAEIVHWYGNDGSLINSNFINSKYYNSGSYSEKSYYLALVASEYYVYFNNAANVINVTFTGSKNYYIGPSGHKYTIYDLYVPDPVEKYVVNFTGSFKKHDTSASSISAPGYEVIVSVNNVASGSVTYRIDEGEPVTVQVNDEGKVIISVTGLEGKHNITYSYSGNAFYNGVESVTSEFEVIGNITPTYTINVIGDKKIGSTVTITVTQDTGDAEYTITLNGKTISNGYSFVISRAGDYNITVQNKQDRYNNPASETVLFNVERAIQYLSIDVVKNGKIGQEIIFTVSGNQTPVVVKVNDVVNTEGKFTPMDGGVYVITAEASQDEAYYANSTSASVSVPDRLTPNYNIEIGTVTIGSPVEITITSSMSDVVYAVTIDGVTQNVTDNKVTYTPETAGEYSIVVFNAKSNEYNAVSVSRTFATEKQYQFISIDVKKNVNIGDEVVFTVSGNQTPVVVKVNGLVNDEGKFTPANSGEYIISAEADENNEYYSDSITVSVTVADRITPTYEINVSADCVNVGSPINITITPSVDGIEYTVTINGVAQTVTDNNITYTPVVAGEFTIIVSNNQSNIYNAASVNKMFAAVKQYQSVVITVNKTAEIGEEVKFTISGNQTPVVVKVNGVVNAEGKFTPADGGSYVISAEASETDAYYGNYTSAIITVADRVTPTYEISVASAVVGSPVEITITPSVDGVEYNVTINGVAQTVTDNKVIYTPETEGVYTIVVSNVKSNSFNANSASTKFTANIKPADIKQYQSVVITVNKTAEIGEEVKFTISGNQTPVVVKVNGVVNAEGKFTPADGGSYVISAEASETDAYYGNYTSAIITVADRVTPTYEISVASAVVGSPVEITITPSVDGVEYNVTINGVAQTVTDNKVTYTPTVAGMNSIIVSNVKSNKYDAASANKMFAAVKQYQSVVIDVNKTAEIGQEVKFTISGNQTSVVVRVNGVVNTVGTFTPSGSGSYVISAEAAESEAYYANTTFATVTVGNIITPSYEIIVGSAVVGSPVNITIVPSVANLAYTVTINGVAQTVTNNVVTYTPAVAGVYTVIASNTQSDLYNAASANKVFNVAKQSQSIVIDVVGTAIVGEEIIFSVSGNQTPVVVRVNGVVNTAGNFTPAVSGTYVISASAAESELYYADSTSVNVTVIDRITPTYAISVGSAIVGNPVVISITPSVENITYTVTINGVAQTVVNNKVTYTPRTAAQYTIVVSNGQYAIYNATSVSTSFNAVKDTVKITAKSAAKSYKASKTKKLTITLKNSKGKSLGKVKITLKVNKKLTGSLGKKLKKGYTFTVKLNSKGVGAIKLTAKKVKGFKKGTYKFTVTYKGSALYKAATKKNIKMKIK